MQRYLLSSLCTVYANFQLQSVAISTQLQIFALQTSAVQAVMDEATIKQLQENLQAAAAKNHKLEQVVDPASVSVCLPARLLSVHVTSRMLRILLACA